MTDSASWQDLRDSFLEAVEESGPGAWIPIWRLVIEHPWYQQELRTIAKRVLRSRGAPLEWHEDIEHDAMLLLARKLRKSPDLGVDRTLAQEHFAGWLATITANDCLDALRRFRRHSGRSLELPEYFVADESRAAEQVLAELSLALDQLDELRRTVLLLYAKGRMLREIAADLGLDYSKTRRLYHSGLERLRALLYSSFRRR